MMQIVLLTLLVAGALFMLIAAVGVMRLPDVYMRMSATTKATTFGLMLMLLAALLAPEELEARGRILAVMVFLLLTNPVAGQMIGRAAWLARVPLWRGTLVDQMRDHPNSPEQNPSASPAKSTRKD